EKERERPRTIAHPASISSASGSLGSYNRQVTPTAPCAAMPELQKADEGAHSVSRTCLQRSGLLLRGMRSKGAAFCATADMMHHARGRAIGTLRRKIGFRSASVRCMGGVSSPRDNLGVGAPRAHLLDIPLKT